MPMHSNDCDIFYAVDVVVTIPTERLLAIVYLKNQERSTSMMTMAGVVGTVEDVVESRPR